jgi:aminoglycoside N3'-acetyltransferase
MIILCLTVSCSNPTNKQEHRFDLKKDLYDFSTRMNESDTLIIRANLSLCISQRHEKNIIFKKNKKLFITTIIDKDYLEPKDRELGTVKYQYIKTDSLNFEDLFQFLENKGATKKSELNSPTFTVVYKKDSIEFYSDKMKDFIEDTKYYREIQIRRYPESKVYQGTPKLIKTK